MRQDMVTPRALDAHGWRASATKALDANSWAG
jgi:hypothetical protein